MDKLPLDARLLSNAVIELNIARHLLALYPRDHQLSQSSLGKTFAIFGELFELRSKVTLAIAKDTLIIDDHRLDPNNPVYREFALALSRMSIAFVSFVKGMTEEEMYRFFRFLSRDTAGVSSETLPQILAEYRLPHILVEPLDFRAFAFAEDRVKKDKPDTYLLERHIKGLLDGGLPATSVQMLIEEIEPGALAAMLNQSGHAVARESAYDTVVGSYLRDGAGRKFSSADLQRLMTFIAGLRPELKQQFLSSSVRALASNPGALNQALESVSVDSIIELFDELDRSRVVLPEALRTLLSRFARTGIELPGGGLTVDDVLLSRELAGLFRDDGSVGMTPESYQAEIRQLLETPGAGASGPAGLELDQEMEEDYVRYCHANALLALMDSPIPQQIQLEDEAIYAAAFTALAARSVETGQYPQLLELLTRFEDFEHSDRHRGVVFAVREHCQGTEFIASIVDSFLQYGRANRDGAALVCSYYGERIVPPLFDAMAVEPRMHVRKLLLQLLDGLGERVAREATLLLRDRRWYVRRNALYLLAETGARCDRRILVRLCRDKDPRVRLQSARCLLRAGEPEGIATLRKLLHDSSSGVVDAAVVMVGVMGVRELIPDLAALAKKSVSAEEIHLRLRLVRTLGQLGGDQATGILRKLLGKRVFLLPRETERIRSEVRKALQRIAGKRLEGGTPGNAPPRGAP